MALFPKVIFQWKEPKAIVLARDIQEAKQRRWWHGLPWVLIAGGSLLPLWYLARLNPNKNAPSFGVALLLAAFFGIFLSYIVPMLIRLCPSEIKISEKSLLMTRGNSHRTSRWDEFFSFTVEQLPPNGILNLEFRNGRRILIGIGGNVDSESLAQFLTKKGLEHRNSEQDAS